MKANEFHPEKKLRSVIKEGINDKIDEIDFYEDINYIDFNYSKLKTNRKRKSHKLLAIVASVALILILSGTIAIFISNEAVNASLFEFEKTYVKLKNAIMGNKNSSYEQVNEDSIVAEIYNLEDLDMGIDFFPELFISKNVPERFSFKSLVITKYSNHIYNAVYLYEDNNEQILTISQQTIPQDGLSVSLVGITDEIKTGEGIIYISENPFGDGGNSATYEKKDFYIDVAGMIEKDEMLRILGMSNKGML
jgi:hypothetical protein